MMLGMHEGFWWLWMTLFWVVVIGLIIWGVRAGTTKKERIGARDTHLAIAERRYAQGEITREEFQEIKAAIR